MRGTAQEASKRHEWIDSSTRHHQSTTPVRTNGSSVCVSSTPTKHKQYKLLIKHTSKPQYLACGGNVLPFGGYEELKMKTYQAKALQKTEAAVPYGVKGSGETRKFLYSLKEISFVHIYTLNYCYFCKC